MPFESKPTSPSLRSRFFHPFRSKPSGPKLTKTAPLEPQPEFITPWDAHRAKYKENETLVDKQLGERRDDTALLHGLTSQGSLESLQEHAEVHVHESKGPGEALISSLPSDIWRLILDHLSLIDAANLALTSKALHGLVGTSAWAALNQPENHALKLSFLRSMDPLLPSHLLCFPCATFHLRSHPGAERLKPHQVLNSLFSCPGARAHHALRPAPLRLTPKHFLPFAFLQLALRAHAHTPAHGVPLATLSRRWSEAAWSHSSRYAVHGASPPRLHLRVSSTRFARGALPPSSVRLLLFSRHDYSPYFSVCAHWRDGRLMDVCRCALAHIPADADEAPRGLAAVRRRVDGGRRGLAPVVPLCARCRPLRRCPECPTEYLVEVKLAEDRSDNSFRHAIVVTRWSDLGSADLENATAGEWAACAGTAGGEGYDSFQRIGKRAISGVFEAGFTDEHIPGQRLLSLNPAGVKKTEEDSSWY